MARTQGALNKRTIKILEAVQGILETVDTTTVRFVLYKLISLGMLVSTQKYQSLVTTLTTARIRGEIDDDKFVDEKRRVIEPVTWSDLSDYGDSVVGWYKRSRWEDHEARVEIWVEKNTVAGVIEDMTSEWQVPMRASSGYFSRPFLCKAAEEINGTDKPTYIYYIGDFDPSGMDIERAAREGNGEVGSKRREGLYDILRGRYSWSELRISEQVYWDRLAVKPEEFDALPDYARVPIKLLAEPGKTKGDTRAKAFEVEYGGFGAEVEALDQQALRGRIEAAIRPHVNEQAWEKSERREKADKKRLRRITRRW